MGTAPSKPTRASRLPSSPVASILALPVLLCGCRGGVLDPQGVVGKAERVILYDATAIMLAVVVPVIVLTLVFAWWFRAGNRRATYLPDWDYSGRIEMITWSVPALVVCFLGGMAWIGSHELHPPKPLAGASAPVEVDVVALDWRWLFLYRAQGVASLNQLTIPAGVPIHFRITATSVMNSFFIPQLGSQIYAMPGMTTQLYLQADQPGTYQGLSAQFSGDGFSDMRFQAVAVPADAFEHWIEAVRRGGGVLDRAAFAQLARPARAEGTTTYAHVAAGLFDEVARWPMRMDMPMPTDAAHEGH